MAKHTRKETIKVFLDVSGMDKEERENIKSPKDIPLSVLIPAFMVSEISVAFQIVFFTIPTLWVYPLPPFSFPNSPKLLSFLCFLCYFLHPIFSQWDVRK
jgi:hypothetical protein